MRDLYPDKTVNELLEMREAIRAARLGGSQIGVGIAPGIKHDFSTVPYERLTQMLLEVDYSLFVHDPDNYSNPAAPNITRPNFSV